MTAGRARSGSIIPAVATRVVGALLLAAAVPKIASPESFARAVYRYALLPDALVNLVAVYLPWLEAVVGLSLLVGMRRRAALGTAFVLAALFTGATASALARGLPIACACFTLDPSAAPLGPWEVSRTAALAAACGLLWGETRHPRHSSLFRSSPRMTRGAGLW